MFPQISRIPYGFPRMQATALTTSKMRLTEHISMHVQTVQSMITAV